MSPRIGFAGSPPESEAEPEPVIPVLSGSRVDVMTGSGYKSFPGMCIDSDDRLHLVYRFGTGHNSAGGSSEIDYKYSDDDGVNWSHPGSAAIILETSATPTLDLRDPCILWHSSDRLVLGYDTRLPYNSDNIEGKIIYSDDGGTTWSSPYSVPSAFSGSEDSVISSQMIELDNGDILLPTFGHDGGDAYVVIFKSTDDGATFAELSTISSGSRDYQEPQIRLLASGDIVCLMRSESNHHTWRCVSTDDGATWSTPADVNDFTGRPDFVEFTPGTLLLVGRFDTTGDSPLYWSYSTDDGVTWAPETELDAGETKLGMYSAPVVTSDQHVTMVYSLEGSGSDADLYLRRFVAA